MTQTYSDPSDPGCKAIGNTAVKTDSTRTEELPIYESLIRELGDVVEEARVVAEETQHQMSQALNGVAPTPPEPGAH